MANPPHNDQLIELHVRKSPGGAFSSYVFEEMKERAILRFEGPLGTFYLRGESDKPLIFVAGFIQRRHWILLQTFGNIPKNPLQALHFGSPYQFIRFVDC